MSAPAWARGMALLVVTFAAGVAVGVGYQRRRAPTHASAAGMAHHMMRRLSDELALDSAQRLAVEAILARRQATVDSTWHTLRPRVHAALDSTLREISGVLRPDQLAAYRRMVAGVHPEALPHAPPRDTHP